MRIYYSSKQTDPKLLERERENIRGTVREFDGKMVGYGREGNTHYVDVSLPVASPQQAIGMLQAVEANYVDIDHGDVRAFYGADLEGKIIAEQLSRGHIKNRETVLPDEIVSRMESWACQNYEQPVNLTKEQQEKIAYDLNLNYLPEQQQEWRYSEEAAKSARPTGDSAFDSLWASVRKASE